MTKRVELEKQKEDLLNTVVKLQKDIMKKRQEMLEVRMNIAELNGKIKDEKKKQKTDLHFIG